MVRRVLDTDERLARHYPVGPPHEGRICNACESSWPCDVALARQAGHDEAAPLRTFRDAIDAASVAYHGHVPRADADTREGALLRLERAVRLASTKLQDDLDGAPRLVSGPAPMDAREAIAEVTTEDDLAREEADRALWDATLAYGAAQEAAVREGRRLRAINWAGNAAEGQAHSDAIEAMFLALDALDAAYAAHAARAGDGGGPGKEGE